MARRKNEEGKRKAVIIAIMALLLALFVGISIAVSVPIVHSAAEPESFRAWIDSLGFLGAGAYFLLVVLQVVVAFIPGEPVEILGGYAFGILEGTLLYLIGAFVGSVLVFLLVRRFGRTIAEIFFPKEKLDSLSILHTSPKRTLIFTVIFTIPGTPKDLLAYFAGLTDMKFSHWMLIAGLGRIPAVVTSTIIGSGLGEGQYFSALITLGATLIISVIGLLVYKLVIGKKQ